MIQSPYTRRNFLSNSPGAVSEANLSTSDVTTLDVSTTKHGFAPKAPNDAAKFLDGLGAYSVPPGYLITLNLAVGNSPADGQTLYLGADTAVFRTTYADASLRIPRAGTLKNVYVKVIVAGTLGTTENVTLSIRINDTTDVALGTMTWAAVSTGLNANVSQAVAAGDTFVLKIVCPTWATNPTTVRLWAGVYIE